MSHYSPLLDIYSSKSVNKLWHCCYFIKLLQASLLSIVNKVATCYVQAISDLLGQLVASPTKLSTLLQDANNLLQICQTTGNKQCERILISAWWTDLLQLQSWPKVPVTPSPLSMLFLFFNSLEFSAGSLEIFSMDIHTFSIASELEYWCAQMVIEQHLSMPSISVVWRSVMHQKRQWNVCWNYCSNNNNTHLIV